ncbi:McrB family protein [Prevotella sp. P5-64]|uniref:McrB family protein n=1 Tax=Prevotella sp. P5-64 TaxID=2024226 RepID=UPI000B973F5B|nr:hypothetical protein [Prevotella sp. P5-64]OYP65287.1 hypothetical protein CIK87_13685 [Prevotella sp. P5-64]
MATFILTEEFKEILNKQECLKILQQNGFADASAFTSEIIKRVNKFDSTLKLDHICYHKLEDTDKYIGVILDANLNKKYNVCILPPLLRTRSGFLTQQIFGFISNLILANNKPTRDLGDKPVLVINCCEENLTNSKVCNIIGAKIIGFNYIDIFNRAEDFGTTVNTLAELEKTYNDNGKDTSPDYSINDKTLSINTSRLNDFNYIRNEEGKKTGLTNQPYYFAINTYPAVILAHKEGYTIDLDKFKNCYAEGEINNNKNIDAFIFFTEKLKKLPINYSLDEITKQEPYLNAIRTKPFLLLAGISGTGKSRIVRELAFKSCPKYLQDKDGTTPGNYCMIEVKPNWHDSTELLGYYSNLSKGYQFKKFVQFLVKAKMNPEIPFFVCLDEMNLAPVEQYFAEILSILETRKHPKNGAGEVDMSVIKSGVIVEGKHFSQIYQKEMGGVISTVEKRISDGDWYASFFKESQMSEEEKAIVQKKRSEFTLCDEGLTLPDNVIIIGTVNMDDTTHQFSRKVIDRAMTIEMNGGKLKNMFGGSNNLQYLEEEEQKKWQAAFKQEYVSADEVLAAHPNEADDIVQILPEKLEAINVALKGTPFEVSYRVLNELTIMVGVMLDYAPDKELEKIVDNALDRILLMKILPRIEGDSDMFNLKTAQTVGGVTCHNRLEWLRELAPSINYSEEEGKDHQQTAKKKIEEMIERLENQEFTRFWP